MSLVNHVSRPGRSDCLARPNADTIERFAGYISVRENGCWQWLAAPPTAKYGMFFNGKRSVRAHRWSYECFIGPIPSGLQLDHLCVNPFCVCPEHLEPVTARENMRRVRLRNLQATHCSNGHLFTPETTRFAPTQHGALQRRCRLCNNESTRRSRERKRRLAVPREPRSHCKYGHEFTPENTYVSKRGSRYCRACTRRLQREYHQRRRASSSPTRSAEASSNG